MFHYGGKGYLQSWNDSFQPQIPRGAAYSLSGMFRTSGQQSTCLPRYPPRLKFRSIVN